MVRASKELRLLGFCCDVRAAFCTKLTGGTENCPEGLLGGDGKAGRGRPGALCCAAPGSGPALLAEGDALENMTEPESLPPPSSPSCDLGEMHERSTSSFACVAFDFRPSFAGGSPGGGAFAGGHFPGGQPLGVDDPRGEEATEERGLVQP